MFWTWPSMSSPSRIWRRSLVDDRALLVHHLVVLEDVLADLEVLLLDLGLRALDGLGDHLRLDRHVVGQVEPGHDRLERGAVEAAHQLVAEREVEAGLARVALTAGTTTQLVVDTARLVALGAEHVQTAGLADLLGVGLDLLLDLLERGVPGGLVLVGGVHRVEALLAQRMSAMMSGLPPSTMSVPRPAMLVATVTAPGRPASAMIWRFLLVELRVEHGVRDAALGELLGQVLRALDAGGTDQDRLALLVPLDDVVDDGVELGLLRLVDQVGLVVADHRLVRRDRDHAEAVDLVQLGGLGLGGTGHARQLARRGGSSSAG